MLSALTFVETRPFTARIATLGLEEALRKLQLELLANPQAGVVDRGTGGLRKVRIPDPERGKGKRGGGRPSWSASGRLMPEGTAMDDKLFRELLGSAKEALAHAEGRLDLRTTVLPPPPEPMSAEDVKDLRDRLNLSQAVLAHCLNVSPKLVQAWEAGRRTPDGPALLLLRLAEQRPELVCRGLDLAADTPRKRAARKRMTRSRS